VTRVVPAERAEPVVPEDQVAPAVGVTQEGPAVPEEDRAVPVDLVELVELVVPEDQAVVDPAVPGALVEVQVDPAGDRVAPAGTSDASQYSAQSICPNPTLTTCQRIANDRLK